MRLKILNRIFWFSICFSISFVARCENELPFHFILKHLPLSSKEISKMEQGEAISKLMSGSIKKEIYTFGASKMDFALDYFLTQYRDVESFKPKFSECATGMLNQPVSGKSFAKLKLTSEELQSIRDCRPGKCKLNLSDEMIQRLKQETQQTQNSREKTEQAFRTLLADYVEKYMRSGVTALIRYHHRKDQLSLEQEFSSMVRASTYFTESVPELADHIRNYPKSHLEGADDFVYWSKEEFGLKPVISITHVTIYRPLESSNVVWIATRQIFSSRYTEGWFSVSILCNNSNEIDAPNFYLFFFNRTRSTNFQGAFGSLKRSLVESRACPKLQAALKSIELKIGAQYRSEAALVAKRK